MKTKIPGYYTISEAAKVLGKSPQMVSRYIHLGFLNAKTLGREKLIEQTDVHDFKPAPRGNPNFRKRCSA